MIDDHPELQTFVCLGVFEVLRRRAVREPTTVECWFGHEVQLAAGEVLFSANRLAEEGGISNGQMRGVLQRLERSRLIKRKSLHVGGKLVGTIATIHDSEARPESPVPWIEPNEMIDLWNRELHEATGGAYPWCSMMGWRRAKALRDLEPAVTDLRLPGEDGTAFFTRVFRAAVRQGRSVGYLERLLRRKTIQQLLRGAA